MRRIRTSDAKLFRLALYQLSYHSIFINFCGI
nr:MAG TPA: hypothetical protein [Caudoviricetes sp.]